LKLKILNKITSAIFLIVTSYSIYYIDEGIRSGNLNFYFGKDNGYILRFESIIIFNAIFFFLNFIQDNQKITKSIIKGLLGGLLAIFISIACYIIISTDNYGTAFHITSIILCYASFFITKKLNINQISS